MPAPDLSWSSQVIQVIRDPDLVAIALALPPEVNAQLPAQRGHVLDLSSDDGHVARAYFHGSMRTWHLCSTLFGAEMRAALDLEPGIDAYLEGSRVAGAQQVPGHSNWLRLRACVGR